MGWQKEGGREEIECGTEIEGSPTAAELLALSRAFGSKLLTGCRGKEEERTRGSGRREKVDKGELPPTNSWYTTGVHHRFTNIMRRGHDMHGFTHDVGRVESFRKLKEENV